MRRGGEPLESMHRFPSICSRRHWLTRPCPAGLPPLPIPLPLIVQLQRVNGSCFEADYGADGVVRNDPATGRFKAHGTP